MATGKLRENNVAVTNASGVHADPMAEQVFGMLLTLARGMHRSIRKQMIHEWTKLSSHKVWELRGKTILIVGLGAIGSRIAELAAAFDMPVIGVRRSAQPDAELKVVKLTELMAVLPVADIVVSVLPMTNHTRHVFNKDAFAAMKKGAVFVNMGRGGSVDQPALVAALASGHLSAAGLDVTEPEPLPDDSPLWDMENVIITPHMGGARPAYMDRVWPIFITNLKRFREGEPLLNSVNLAAGY